MGFCNGCGDIVAAGRCPKCGGRAIASVSNGLDTVDRWTSHYMNTIQSKELERTEKLLSRQTTLRPSVLNAFGSVSDPLRRRPTLSLQTPFRRACADCQKQLYPKDPSLVDPEQKEKQYCVDCFQLNFSKGNCRSCFKPVFPSKGAYVNCSTKFWHKECFVCRWCDKNLGGDPMVDLGGAPCCEDCLMKKAGQRPAESPSVHAIEPLSPSGHGLVVQSPSISPSSPSMLPRIDSPFSSISDLYDRMDTMSSRMSSIRLSERRGSGELSDDWASDKFSTISSVRAPPPVDDMHLASPRATPYRPTSPTSTASEFSSRPTTPVSMMSYASSKASSNLSSDTSGSSHDTLHNRKTRNKAKSRHTRERSHSLPPPLDHRIPEIIEPESAQHESTHEQYRDTNDHDHDHDTDGHVDIPPITAFSSPQRSRRNSVSSNIPGSSRCHFCGDFVRGSAVKVPSGELYHHDCLRCHKCRMTFEESNFITNQNQVYHVHCAPQTKVVGLKVQCPRCLEDITSKYFNIDGVRYHTHCFTCTGCVRAFRSKNTYAEVDGLPYCESCCTRQLENVTPDKIVPAPRIRTFPTSALPQSPVLVIDKPHSSDAPLSPSSPSVGENGRPLSLFSQRTTPLPKFGGSKVCPRCQKAVSVMDQTPGPKATKCHKKCLQCTGCKKQLDSGALVREDEEGWLPYCRACYTRAGGPRMSMYEQNTLRTMKASGDRRSVMV